MSDLQHPHVVDRAPGGGVTVLALAVAQSGPQLEAVAANEPSKPMRLVRFLSTDGVEFTPVRTGLDEDGDVVIEIQLANS